MLLYKVLGSWGKYHEGIFSQSRIKTSYKWNTDKASELQNSIHKAWKPQCVRACPTDVLEMIPSDGCKAKQIASAPRTEDCVGCKRCESACPTDFLSVRVYLGPETTWSMGLAYWYVSKNTTRIRFFTGKNPC